MESYVTTKEEMRKEYKKMNNNMDLEKVIENLEHLKKTLNLSDDMKESLNIAAAAVEKRIPKQPVMTIRRTYQKDEIGRQIPIKEDYINECRCCGRRIFKIRDESCPRCWTAIEWE